VRLDVVERDVEVVVEEGQHAGGRFVVGLGFGVLNSKQFDAVAGGEDDGFADTGLVRQGAGGVGEPGDRDGEALAHVNGRGGVVDTEEEQLRVGVLVRQFR
jgi:hypothetical protein